MRRCRFGNAQPKILSLSIQKSATKNCVAVDSEMGSRNCVAVDSKISSQKLCGCPFKKLAAETASLPIQKSATKLCRCQFRSRQPKTAGLLIKKSAAKNCVTADSENDSDGEVISALHLSFFTFFF
jgi:hypothetical protein